MEANHYTLDQLAIFFFFCIATVDKWIANGRIKDMDKHIERISDRAIWLSEAGKEVPIREVLERYLLNQMKEVNTIEMDEEEYEFERLKEIVMTINFFEKRYGGSYEQIVLENGDPDRTDDWQWGREGKEWSYLMEISKSPEMIAKIKEELRVEELDRWKDDFPDGVFALPSTNDSPKVKVRALLKYCRQHKKQISDLNEEDLEQFLDRKNE